MRVAASVVLAASACVRVPYPRCTATAPVKFSDLADEACRLSDAQFARTVAAACTDATVCTALDAPGADGASFASHALYVVDDAGCPLLAIEPGSQSLVNLAKDRTATFFARSGSSGVAAGSSVALVGSLEDFSVDEITDAQLSKLSAASDTSVADVAAKTWQRFVPQRVHLVDSIRGAESWIATSEYAEAEPNALAECTTALLSKLNSPKYAPSLRRFAAVYASTPDDSLDSAAVLSIDPLGFDLLVNADGSPRTFRVGFNMPPQNEEEALSLFMKLFQEAYERANGFM